jgi:hypothetical protein
MVGKLPSLVTSPSAGLTRVTSTAAMAGNDTAAIATATIEEKNFFICDILKLLKRLIRLLIKS